MGQYSSAKVHRALNIKSEVEEPRSFEDYVIELSELDDLKVEVLDGR